MPSRTSRQGSGRSGDIKTIVLVDGEHYPPVVADAIEVIGKTDEVLAAVFIGGTEKITGLPGEELWGIPVITEGDAIAGLNKAIDEFKPESVFDLSDEPVIGYRKRLALANAALIKGVDYRGADFTFTAPRLPKIAEKPTVRVIGTGKRVGKTAVSAYLARELKEAGWEPIVLAMGRGGPPEPEVLYGGEVHLDAESLLALADAGKHAASDYVEDALMSRITTVGCRRCGGGLAGEPVVSNVIQGTKVANGLPGDIIVLEGSGSSLPPVAADASLVTIAASTPLDYVRGYFGPYRVITSQVAVVTNCDDPDLDAGDIDALERAIREVNPGIRVIRTEFRLKPLDDVRGQNVFLATTAPERVLGRISADLEESTGCTVVAASSHLSNRTLLRQELAAEKGNFSVILTELKAAAVDVVTREGRDQGLPVVYCDNVPMTVGGDGELADAVRELAIAARQRFQSPDHTGA